MSDVELNLAAMLDMAFQLLTFFILTFRPAPLEGDILLKLPPPVPTNLKGDDAGADPDNKNPMKGLETLIISVLSTPSGGIKTIVVGDAEVGNSPANLDSKLKTVLGDSGTGFEQVLINVDQKLHYDSLMQIIGVCNKQKMPDGTPLGKLSFVELPSM